MSGPWGVGGGTHPYFGWGHATWTLKPWPHTCQTRKYNFVHLTSETGKLCVSQLILCENHTQFWTIQVKYVHHFKSNLLKTISCTVVRHQCAQHCNSKNEHNAVAVKTSTALWQQWYDSTEIVICTLVWQWWQLTVLWQCCQLPLLSQWCAHRCHTSVNIAVRVLSVDTSVTALPVPPLS